MRHCILASRKSCAIPILLVAVMGTSTVVAQQNADEKILSAPRVRSSIARGIGYLRSKQTRGGAWTRMPAHPAGVTALCTLALLNCGVEPTDPVIRRSIDLLDGFDLQGGGLPRPSVYSVSLMTMVYCMAAPETRLRRIRECVEYLEASQVQGRDRGDHQGGWPYNRGAGRPDASNSQFALLALHEASLVGIDVDPEVWQRALWYWQAVWSQNTGGFFYSTNRRTTPPTGSMTSAGISSLIIIDEHMPKALPLRNGKIQCCLPDDRLEVVEAAHRWLGDRFSVRRNPAEGNSMFRNSKLYYLYGLERAARLSGVRYFGSHDWYREGAEHLLRTQRGGGSWQGISGHGETDPNVATSFALLFLSKGRRPIVIGKYQHADSNDWDRHRKGVHYLTRVLESDWEIKLNWQTIEGRHATTDDLLEAPVLFISGRDGLNLTANQKQRLKEYVEYGGFIFAEACQGDGCGENAKFDRDFRQLMSELFPDSSLQLLDESHPVFNAQYSIPPIAERPLYGLQSSCRTSVIYCPRNLAGFWRLNRPAFMDALPDAPKQQVEYVTKLGVNVIAYATGREFKEKLDRPQIVDAMDDGLGQRVVLIPKLTHGGGADDAPNAWQNIVRRARFDLRQRFKIQRMMIEPRIEQLAKYPMVFMHGRSQFQWNDQDRAGLTAYFENGGFLFADSICSSNPFAESFREEIQKLFPDIKLAEIPANDVIWSDVNGGYLLDSVRMHKPAQVAGGVERFRSAPQLEGIKVNGRWVVVFSPNDLSCAMENASAAQCAGYDKDDAARIGVNVILYALQAGN